MLLGLTMQMQQLNTEGWAKTYLIWDDESKEGALIDPVFDFTNSYLSTIEQMGLTLTMCIVSSLLLACCCCFVSIHLFFFAVECCVVGNQSENIFPFS